MRSGNQFRQHPVGWNTFQNAQQGMNRKLLMGAQTGKLTEEFANNLLSVNNQINPDPEPPLFADLANWWDFSKLNSMTFSGADILTIADRKNLNYVVTASPVGKPKSGSLGGKHCMTNSTTGGTVLLFWDTADGSLSFHPAANSMSSYLVIQHTQDIASTVDTLPVASFNGDRLALALAQKSVNFITSNFGTSNPVSGNISISVSGFPIFIMKDTYDVATNIATKTITNSTFLAHTCTSKTPIIDGAVQLLNKPARLTTNAAELVYSKIGEHLIYNRILTAPESLQVENYLKTKWGIVNI
jgi:hypothetical protein